MLLLLVLVLLLLLPVLLLLLLSWLFLLLFLMLFLLCAYAIHNDELNSYCCGGGVESAEAAVRLTTSLVHQKFVDLGFCLPTRSNK